MARSIPTFTGSVDEDALGVTLIHEHIFVTDPELDVNMPHPEWDEQAWIERAVQTLTSLYDHGARTVVDLTVIGLGRDVRRVAEVASRVPVQIVAATGCYAAEVLPPYFRLNGPGLVVDGPDPLLELFVGDIEQGIAGTGVRAGMIKVASDAGGLTPDASRVFAAAASAHLRTGVPITTHSHAASRGGIAQQDALERLGVPLDRVVIGHSGDSAELPYLRGLADRGSFLGFDRFGMENVGSDEDRIRMLLQLLDAGYADRIVLSHDAAVFSRVTPPSWRAAHTPKWTMTHLFERILPRLRAAGLDAATEHQLMVVNPRRVLAGAA
ncbi:phosphotriesterase family protein [Microbacterium aerolatum]|uniref:Phosphotriesterase n=1 Tax=Microbacterium aerolatum TaxID=153731 RepID=A0A511AGS9_9MICO|nr:phosphotriesterase-related protein [Microbacterium aerolatum]GEK87390.1 phosphotriesterase [Microbacterium aerolatum]GGB33163.1 phosphotriesterase [Microbacterium aerolatum]